MKIEILKGFIYNVEGDAIVTSTDPMMSGKGGLDYMIHRTGGRRMEAVCRRIRENGGIPPRTAVITPSFSSYCDYIVHVPVPRYIDGKHGEFDQLAASCRLALAAADAYGKIHTLLMTPMGTGGSKFPKCKPATMGFSCTEGILLATIHRYMVESRTGSLEKVSIVCRNDSAYETLCRMYRIMFGNGLPLYERIRGSVLGFAVGDAVGYSKRSGSLRKRDFEKSPIPLVRFKLVSSGIVQMMMYTACGVMVREAESPPGEVRFDSSVLEPALSDRMRTLEKKRPQGERGYWVAKLPFMRTWKGPEKDRSGTWSLLTAAVPAVLWYAAHPPGGGYSGRSLCRKLGESLPLPPEEQMAAAVLYLILLDVLQNFSIRYALWDADRFLKVEYRDVPQHEELYRRLQAAVRLSRMAHHATALGLLQAFHCEKDFGYGWAGTETVPLAVACILDPRDFRHNIRSAVAQPGNSCGTAGIAGLLHGALRGASEIPDLWMEKLEMADYLKQLARDLYTGPRMGSGWRDKEWDMKYVSTQVPENPGDGLTLYAFGPADPDRPDPETGDIPDPALKIMGRKLYCTATSRDSFQELLGDGWHRCRMDREGDRYRVQCGELLTSTRRGISVRWMEGTFCIMRDMCSDNLFVMASGRPKNWVATVTVAPREWDSVWRIEYDPDAADLIPAVKLVLSWPRSPLKPQEKKEHPEA